MPKVQVNRVSSGNYTVSVCDRTFDIDRVSHDEWQLCEVEQDCAGTPRREYWNHFSTKRAAIEATSQATAA